MFALAPRFRVIALIAGFFFLPRSTSNSRSAAACPALFNAKALQKKPRTRR